MIRKSVFILALLCFLAISNYAIAAQFNWVGTTSSDWFDATNWGNNAVPTSSDWVCIQPGPPAIINGDAACSPLDISPWSGGGTGLLDVNSGTLNFGSALNCATWGDFDSTVLGPGVLYVHGGTITTQSDGSAGLVIGSQFSTTAGRVIMYGGLISVPRITLYQGDITLYGGTLELRNSADDTSADFNFVFSQNFMGNKIDISGGTLQIAGNMTTTLGTLITNKRIYSSRGNLGIPTYTSPWTTLISSDNNMLPAYNPTPEANATNVHYKYATDPCYITLSWSTGDVNVINTAVYFGTNANIVNSVYGDSNFMGEVNEANLAVLPNGEPNTWSISTNFSINTAYYWRVDVNSIVSFNEDGSANTRVTKGRTWKFTTHDGKAYNYTPIAGAALSEPLQLSWTAGDFATIHRVFFGTQFSSVDNASTSSTDGRYRGTVSSPAYPISRLTEKGPVAPGASFTLVPGVAYYWRIDEVTGTTVWKGATQTLNPAAYITIDDFEDYNSTADMNAKWSTTYPVSCDAEYPVSNGAVTYMNDAAGKYMRFHYYNKGGLGALWFSEARYAYSTGTSFTGGGALNPAPAALSMSYLGAPTNSVDETYDRMYVAIQDTAGNIGVYFNPDGNAATVTSWTPWFVSLKDINSAGTPAVVKLNDVNAFHLGFGVRCGAGAGGDGNVMFDTIRMYAQTCNPAYARTNGLTADLTGDCGVDINDLDTFANDWLRRAETRTFATITQPAAPILWYKFNEIGTTDMAQDSGTGDANNYVGIINNFTALNWKPEGRDGNGCLYLPAGANSYVNIDVASLSFMGDDNHSSDGGGITFSTWINADLTAFGGWVYGFIVVKDVNGADATTIACPHHYSPSDWSAYGAWAGWNKSNPSGFSLGPSTVPTNYGGRWNHWAFVKSPSALQWYCNGTLIRQEASTDANAGDVNIPGSLFPLPVSAFTIGLGGWGGNWAGKIDDFQVYDNALSAEEIAYLATDGTGSIVLPLTATSNIVYPGPVPDQVVNFADMAAMCTQWRQQIMWP